MKYIARRRLDGVYVANVYGKFQILRIIVYLRHVLK